MTKITKKYFELESERRYLAFMKDFGGLKATYKSKLSLRNRNTGRFWDKIFMSNKKNYLNNPMKDDRNSTASRWFVELIRRNEQQKVLNLGCGSGDFESLVYEKNKKIDYLGIDKAEKTIKSLRERFPEYKFDVKDILTGKFAIGNYSVVCLFEVLEHIPTSNTLRLLRKIHSLLVDKGYFLISVPMNEGLEEMYPYNPNAHLRCYSRELVFAELEMTGFSIVRWKEMYAFNKMYGLKNLISKIPLIRWWKPNNILILARKK